MWVKICGICRPEDAAAAAEAGADAIGLVLADSPRRVSVAQAEAIVAELPPDVVPIALFVDEPLASILTKCEILGVDTVQLHGNEPPDLVRHLTICGIEAIKAFRIGAEADLAALRDYPGTTCLLDPKVPGKRGGTGVAMDWGLAARAAARRRIILAGGLTPDNVAEAIRRVRPWGVDVSSGVEAAPGRKDHAKLRAFILAARQAARRA